MQNKRKMPSSPRLDHTPKHESRSRLSLTREVETSPIITKCTGTSPSLCSTPKSHYSDDSLSQDFDNSNVNKEVVWKWEISPDTRKTRAENKARCEKISEKLARDNFEKSKSRLKEQEQAAKEEKQKKQKISGLEKFKLQLQRLDSEGKINESPKLKHQQQRKGGPSLRKQNANVTRSFTFGLSDDSDDDETQSPISSAIFRSLDFVEDTSKSPANTFSNVKKTDENIFRKTKSAHNFETTSPTTSTVTQDLFDDSAFDQLLFQFKQVEDKINNQESQPNSEQSSEKIKKTPIKVVTSAFSDICSQKCDKVSQTSSILSSNGETPSAYSSTPKRKGTIEETGAKRQRAIASCNAESSSAYSGTPKRQCTLEEIEAKRQRALRIRQERLNKQKVTKKI